MNLLIIIRKTVGVVAVGCSALLGVMVNLSLLSGCADVPSTYHGTQHHQNASDHPPTAASLLAT